MPGAPMGVACAARRVDVRDLAREVVLEQRFVVSGGEQVLIRPDRRRLAHRLLHVRPRRHGRRRRLGAAVGRHEAADERAAVVLPRARLAEAIAETRGARRRACLQRPHVDEPQRRRVLLQHADGQTRPVGREANRQNLPSCRQRHLARRAVGNRGQRHANDIGAAMGGVGARIEPQAGETPHRLRELGDRRHAATLVHGEHVARRREQAGRRPAGRRGCRR